METAGSGAKWLAGARTVGRLLGITRDLLGFTRISPRFLRIS